MWEKIVTLKAKKDLFKCVIKQENPSPQYARVLKELKRYGMGGMRQLKSYKKDNLKKT